MTSYNAALDQAILAAVAELKGSPTEPQISCPGPLEDNVPSEKFVGTTAKNFCNDVMGDLSRSIGPTGYDIYGNKIPVLKALAASDNALLKRKPPVSLDAYKDFRFFLQYEFQQGDCSVAKEDLCTNAYRKLVQSECKFSTHSLRHVAALYAMKDNKWQYSFRLITTCTRWQ
jgi:hypothetical protein